MNSEGVYFYHLDAPNRPETGSIRFYNFASEQVRKIVSLNKPADGGLTVSPDGRWVLYSQRDQQGSDLMIVEEFE